MLIVLLLLVACSYVLATCAYRLLWHPLSSVPGPKLAAVSYLYENFYDIVLPGRYVFRIQELHEKYGPIVRVTPREIHISDVSVLPEIYPTSNASPREKDPVQMRGLDVGQSTSATIDHHLHRARRDYLSPFFSQKNVLSLEPLVLAKVSQLRRYFKSAGEQGQVLNVSDLFFAYARDIVYQASFAKDSNELANIGDAGVLRQRLSSLLLSTKWVKRFPWIHRNLRRLPGPLARRLIPDGAREMKELVVKIRGEVEEVRTTLSSEKHTSESASIQTHTVMTRVVDQPNGKAILPTHTKTIHSDSSLPLTPTVSNDGAMLERCTSSGISAEYNKVTDGLLHHRSIFRDLISNAHIPESEKSTPRLTSEGTMLVMAATESTAKTLSLVTYHLAAQSTLLSRLRDELQTTAWPATVSISELENLPLLMACLSEGVRLGYGLTGRNSRVLPAQDLTYGRHVIPRGTPVSMTTLCIHQNEDIFPDPLSFVPDRWLGKEGRERQKYNYGFGRGSRRCLGIQLANAEMVAAIAEIARWDLELFETGPEEVGFERDYQVAFPRAGCQGVRVKVNGRTAS